MHNPDSSTGTPDITFSIEKESEETAKMYRLVKNLELELGYHAIALKKAEKMIQFLQEENSHLRDQNKGLRQGYRVLQGKMHEYERQLLGFDHFDGSCKKQKQATGGEMVRVIPECLNMQVDQRRSPLRSQTSCYVKSVKNSEPVTPANRPNFEKIQVRRVLYDDENVNSLDQTQKIYVKSAQISKKMSIATPTRRPSAKPRKSLSPIHSQNEKWVPFEQLILTTRWD